MKRKLVIAAACGVAVAAPAYALQEPQQTAAVQATGTSLATYAWMPKDTQIAAGGTVTFSNQTAGSHNVVFTSGTPSSCTGLPADPTPQWTGGSCRFDDPGTYAFYCTRHRNMTGTVTVAAATPTPTPTTSVEPGASPTPTPDPGSRPGGGNPQRTLSVTLAKSQRGARVRGSVDVAAAGSRLEVTLWASRRSLSGGKSRTPVRIGRTTRPSAPAGKVAFAVGADAKARSALRRHHRLSVTVRVALTPPGGHELTRSVKSTLRAG